VASGLPTLATVDAALIGVLDLDAATVRHAPKSWTPSATLIDLLSDSIECR
jgi:hypothetical protein